MPHRPLLLRAIELATHSAKSGRGGPFGAVIARRKEIVAEGVNLVIEQCDPTAHAEIVAIREACSRLGTFELPGLDIYCSCEPNPMCLGAIYWARLARICYAATREAAAAAGFNDLWLYHEVSLPHSQRRIPTRNLLRRPGRAPFALWNASPSKIRY